MNDGFYYQYRWLNPGKNKYVTEDELEWKLLDKRIGQSWETRIAEMEGYRYFDNPCYEVRKLIPISRKMSRDDI
jgi:hypothetical protein